MFFVILKKKNQACFIYFLFFSFLFSMQVNLSFIRIQYLGNIVSVFFFLAFMETVIFFFFFDNMEIVILDK